MRDVIHPPVSRSTFSTAAATTKRKSEALLLLGAPVLFLAAFFFVPLAWIMYLGVWDDGVDLSGYAKLAATPAYIRSFAWTFELAALTTVVTVVLAYPVAYAMTTSSGRVRFLIMLCIVLPFWTSALVRAFSWVAILGRNGIINSVLLDLGLIATPIRLVFNRFGAVVGTSHIMLPYMVLSLYASMQAIDRSVLLAAHSLGASPARAFFLVYVPQTAPGLTAGVVLVFTISLGFFVTPAVLGGSQGPTIAILIEQSMSKLLDWKFAAALSTILLASTLLLYAAFYRQIGGALGGVLGVRTGSYGVFRAFSWVDRLLVFTRRPRYKAEGSGRNGPLSRKAMAAHSGSAVIGIGSFIAFLTAFPILLVLLIAFFPSHSLAVDFSNFSLRWFEMYFARAEWLNATWISAQIAAGCAVLSSILALTSALAIRRLGATATAVLIPVFLAPLVIPALVYGLAAYFLFAQLGLVGTRVALVLAHTSLALPAAFLLMLSGIRSLDARLEDAAASLGASSWKQFRYVTLPLIAPSAGISALVSFLISFDELNTALFLASSSSKTLPKLMYESITFESDPRVTAASAVLVGITVAAFALVYLIRSRSVVLKGG